jgi:hypothetical protein
MSSESNVIAEFLVKLRTRLALVFALLSGDPGASPTKRPYNPRFDLKLSIKSATASTAHITEIAIGKAIIRTPGAL